MTECSATKLQRGYMSTLDCRGGGGGGGSQGNALFPVVSVHSVV